MLRLGTIQKQFSINIMTERPKVYPAPATPKQNLLVGGM